MSKLYGVFDLFDDLELIPIEDIVRWIKPAPSLITLQNFIANRIIYPQAIPTTTADLNIDMAILREALRRNKSFFNEVTRKIIIPEIFISRFSDLSKIAWIFVDAYLLNLKKDLNTDLYTLILRGEDRDDVLGSVLVPQLIGSGMVELLVNGKKVEVKSGALTIIPCDSEYCPISYKVLGGSLFGHTEGIIEIRGGKLGLVIDGRG